MSNSLMNTSARRLAVALGVAASLVVLPGDAPTAQVPSASGTVQGVSPQVVAQIQGLLREKALRSRTQRKMSSQLIYARRMARREAIAQGVSRLDVNVPTAADGRVIVDVRASVTAALIQRLQAAGVTILSAEPNMKAMRLQATLDQIEDIAANDEVDFVRPMLGAVTNRHAGPAEAGRHERQAGRHERFDREALKAAVRRAMQDQGAITQAGSVESQGDTTHAANTARSTYAINGTGVKIGVLSDGVNSRALSQASGDLPTSAGLTIVPGQAGDGDEGTAMLEIIHDLAPGAQLYFATAFNSITSFADNIRTLRNTYGCDIIVDDVFYYVETPFQDGQASSVVSTYNSGVVTQAVKDVSAAGALYFSSAGNSGNLNDGTSGAWEGDFVNGGSLTISPYGDYQIHSFGTQNFNVLTSNGLRVLTLYWADALGASASDYDLFLLNSAGTSIISASVDPQDGTQDPFEAVGFSSSVGTNLRVLIGKFSGSGRFLHLSTNRGRLSIATAGEIHGHAATSAANSFAVAATPARGPYPGRFSTGNSVETFSSDGPRRIFFNADGSAITAGNFSSTGGQVLDKPDLTAADGVSVTGAGGFPATFFGTSAAAPHAAAIAALIKSANLSLTATQVRTALLNSALDIESAGNDRDSGVGIVMADTAVRSVIGPLMAVDSPATSASVVQPFTLVGWAIDRAASNSSGVSGVHVWAHPASGSPTFVGEATYGSTRSDIGTAYGTRFTNSGFSRAVSGLAPGTYTIVASAFSTVTNTFSQSASVTVTIPASLPAMSIDSPANGASPGLSFTLSGWAIDRTASSGTGVDAIHVYAYPSTGSGFGAGAFAGAATLGFSRTDVGAVYGSQFNNSGYRVSVSLSAGTYRLIAYVHSSVTGAFVTQQSVDITAAAPASNPAMSLDGPTQGQTVSQPFVTGGWAIDRGASNGTGVDAIHVWAFPLVNGVVGAGRFVDQATLNGGRPDVAAVFGAQFQSSGFNFLMTGLTPGTYIIGVYCRSGVTGTFNQQRFVTVTVQ